MSKEFTQLCKEILSLGQQISSSGLNADMIKSAAAELRAIRDQILSSGASGGINYEQLNEITARIDEKLSQAEANELYVKKGEAINTDDLLTEAEADAMYAKIEQIPNISGLMPASDAESKFATKEELAAASLGGGDNGAAITQLQNSIDSKLEKSEAELTYAKKSEVPNIDGLLSSEAAEATYAKTSDIPDTSNFAVKTEVEQEFAKKSELPDVNGFITQLQGDVRYALKGESGGSGGLDPELFLQKSEAENYVKKTDLELMAAAKLGRGEKASDSALFDGNDPSVFVKYSDTDVAASGDKLVRRTEDGSAYFKNVNVGDRLLMPVSVDDAAMKANSTVLFAEDGSSIVRKGSVAKLKALIAPDMSGYQPKITGGIPVVMDTSGSITATTVKLNRGREDSLAGKNSEILFRVSQSDNDIRAVGFNKFRELLDIPDQGGGETIGFVSYGSASVMRDMSGIPIYAPRKGYRLVKQVIEGSREISLKPGTQNVYLTMIGSAGGIGEYLPGSCGEVKNYSFNAFLKEVSKLNIQISPCMTNPGYDAVSWMFDNKFNYLTEPVFHQVSSQKLGFHESVIFCLIDAKSDNNAIKYRFRSQNGMCGHKNDHSIEEILGQSYHQGIDFNKMYMGSYSESSSPRQKKSNIKNYSSVGWEDNASSFTGEMGLKALFGKTPKGWRYDVVNDTLVIREYDLKFGRSATNVSGIVNFLIASRGQRYNEKSIALMQLGFVEASTAVLLAMISYNSGYLSEKSLAIKQKPDKCLVLVSSSNLDSQTQEKIEKAFSHNPAYNLQDYTGAVVVITEEPI